MPLIEASLVEFVHYWNIHYICNSRHDCLGGIPDDLYAMPNYYGIINNNMSYKIYSYILSRFVLLIFTGTTDYLKSVDPNMWYEASSSPCNESPPWYSPEFYMECADSIQDEFGIDLNRDIDISNCLDVYNFLVDSYE